MLNIKTATYQSTIFKDLEIRQCFISEVNNEIYRKINAESAYNFTSNRFCSAFNANCPVIPAEFDLVRVK